MHLKFTALYRSISAGSYCVGTNLMPTRSVDGKHFEFIALLVGIFLTNLPSRLSQRLHYLHRFLIRRFCFKCFFLMFVNNFDVYDDFKYDTTEFDFKIVPSVFEYGFFFEI